MAKILRNLRVDDISSVDVGAGRGVRVVLMKRDTSATEMPTRRSVLRKHRDGISTLYGRPLTFGAELSKEALAYLKREFSQDERDERAEDGRAMDDGSFPIDDKEDLSNAIQAVGRAKDPEKAKAHIKARAEDLGAEDMLPDGWQVDKRDSISPQDVLALVDKAVSVAIEKSAVDFSQAYAAGETAEAVGGMMNEVREAVYALDCSICSILGDEDVDDKASAISTSYEQFKTYLAGLGLGSDDDDDDETEKRDMTITALNPQVQKAIEEAVAKVSAAKDAEIAKAMDQIAYLKMSDKHKAYHDGLGSDTEKKKFRDMSDDDKDAEMSKMAKRAEDDPIYKQMRSENEDLRKRLEKIEQERDLEVCKRDAKVMGLTQADAGEVLMKSRRGDRDAHKKLEDYMLTLAKSKTALETTSKVFEEFGTRDTGGTGVSANDELLAKAAELRKSKPELSEAQAFDKVYNDPANRDLRNREVSERMSKIHGRAA